MNITVIGAGKSGLSAALLAAKNGNNVFLSESGNSEKFCEVIKRLDDANIRYEFGANTEAALQDCDLIITSPGVLPSTWIISEADKRAIEIVSELEYGYQNLNNPIIAITGTNGKTTTTTLIAYILNRSGKKAVTAGNIGTPLCDLVGNIDEQTIIVAEVSSFQLDRIKTFRPDVAIILNITPDHLYYHGSFESYQQAKWKISSNQCEKDLLILNKDDNETFGCSSHTKGKVACISMTDAASGIYNRNGEMVLRDPITNNEEVIMVFDEVRLPGVHNAYNSMAAALAVRAFEIRNEDIRDSLMGFEGVEHRLEFVRTIDGVDYINDSKATNVNATWYALSSYKTPIIWIAGGRGDSNDYSQLDDLVKNNVRAIVCIGEEADVIFNYYCTKVRCIKAESLESAILHSRKQALKDDVVLFTPACKSFDMFMNFEHRGEEFKRIVNSMSDSNE